MQLLRIVGVALAGTSVAFALGFATPAAALYGCFCSKQNEDDRICGEVLKFDRESTIVIKPLAKARRTLEPVEFAECRDPTPEPPAPVQCPAGQSLSKGQCIAVVPPPAPTPTLSAASRPSAPAPSPPPAFPPASEADEHFGIAGSNTIGEKLMPALIEAFARSQGLTPDETACTDRTVALRGGPWTLSIACSAHGTHTGIPALAAGTADIAMLSRPINAEERDTMRRAGYPAMDSVRHETVLALDGLLILVAPRNPVRALSIDQIARIFAGEITDWAQVGGAAGRINLYVRDEKSGTRDSFEAMVMEPHGRSISPAATKFESSSELSDRVSADPRGIGFTGFAYQRRARAVPIAQPCGLVHAPSVLAIKAEDYPLSRRLFLYTARLHSVHSADLVHFALSPAAQPVIEAAGYVNQAIASWSAADSEARIAGYAAAPPQEPGLDRDTRAMGRLRAVADRVERLSISFRFRSNSTKLDTKAWQDVLRLAEYMKTVASSRKVLLLGFADSQGSFAANLALSQARANEVRTSLLSTGAGLAPELILARGYSELLPVACNADETGRAKNRRVEVWLAGR